MLWLVLLLAFAEPFWQEKPVAEWTDIQLAQFLADSPWAHSSSTSGKAAPNALPVVAYLASAEPVRKAEQERARRTALRRKQEEDPLAEEYRAWMDDTLPTHIVLAVRSGSTTAFSNGAEIRRMEDGCWMKTSKGKFKLSRYFPPAPHDPILRLAFPRGAAGADEKNLSFELYVPGVSGPFRDVQFAVKDLAVNGKLEF
jgi:hypothetical protein